MLNFYFFLFSSVDYHWSYAYDECLSTLSLSRIDFLCCCFFRTTLIFYSFVSMNTYSPCPSNCKTSNPIHYSRNCSNFLCFFSFLPFIRYPQKHFMQLSVDSIVVVCLLVEYLEIFHFHLLYIFTSLLVSNSTSLCLQYSYESMS